LTTRPAMSWFTLAALVPKVPIVLGDLQMGFSRRTRTWAISTGGGD
jgi:hypothetical protein